MKKIILLVIVLISLLGAVYSDELLLKANLIYSNFKYNNKVYINDVYINIPDNWIITTKDDKYIFIVINDKYLDVKYLILSNKTYKNINKFVVDEEINFKETSYKVLKVDHILSKYNINQTLVMLENTNPSVKEGKIYTILSIDNHGLNITSFDLTRKNIQLIYKLSDNIQKIKVK